MQDEICLLEHKDCAGESITVHKSWWTKVIQEATNACKMPVLVIRFGLGLELYCITKNDFDNYRNYLKEQHNA